MIIRREAEKELRPDQVRAMAHGLYHLAQVDGITEHEEDVIRTFLKDGNVQMDLEALGKIPFSLEELLFSLDTLFLRKAFLKACILLARSDGEVTQEELSELRRLAQALGIDDPFESLIEDIEGKSL